MNNKKNILILSLSLLVFTLALLFFLYAKSKGITVESIIEPKEEIEYEIDTTEVSETKDIPNAKYIDVKIYDKNNNEKNIKDFEELPMMIMFFDETEEDSKEVLDKVNMMYEKYKDRINFVMISISKDVKKEFYENYKMDIYYDFYEEARKLYDIKEYPSMYYLDKDNEIINAKSGKTSADALEANLDIICEAF